MASIVWMGGAETDYLENLGGSTPYFADVAPTNVSISTSVKRTGTRSYRFNPSAAEAKISIPYFNQALVASFYVRFDDLPSGDTWLFSGIGYWTALKYKAGTTSLCISFQPSTDQADRWCPAPSEVDPNREAFFFFGHGQSSGRAQPACELVPYRAQNDGRPVVGR